MNKPNLSFFFNKKRLSQRCVTSETIPTKLGHQLGFGLARFGLLILMALTGCSDPAKQRFPVAGLVTIDGQPAERVLVQFQSLDTEIADDDRYPVAITDSMGRFRLGEKAAKSGAVAGQYQVSFNWLSSDRLDAFDKLKGKYADPAKSDFKVTVPVEAELSFELTGN